MPSDNDSVDCNLIENMDNVVSSMTYATKEIQAMIRERKMPSFAAHFKENVLRASDKEDIFEKTYNSFSDSESDTEKKDGSDSLVTDSRIQSMVNTVKDKASYMQTPDPYADKSIDNSRIELLTKE